MQASRIVEDQIKKTLKTEHPPRREAPRLHRTRRVPYSVYHQDRRHYKACGCSRSKKSRIPVKDRIAIGGDVVDLTGDEDLTDEDGDIGMGDSTGVSASLGGEIFSGGKKFWESTSVELEDDVGRLHDELLRLETRLKCCLSPCGAADRIAIVKGPFFGEDSWNEEPCRDVHQVGDEREVEVLRSFNWPPSELITEDGVLPERVQRVPYIWRYKMVTAVALLKGIWFEVYRDYLAQKAVK
ncbi:hypothetical protein Tco_0939197 [Tanacetum coccineum]|uniref:Uncharacterized protein n=1 Tax=Tanacetum coccineum TaxID=301880 RepID=A0ABQ5DLT0_9ASTR